MHSEQGPVVITGASSFIGAWLLHWLAAHRPELPLVAVVNRTPLSLDGVPMQVVTQDLTAPGAADALSRLQPRTIVHLAAKVMADDGPALNAAMLDTVLEVARRTGAPIVYGSTTQVGWSEQNAYARSKAADEARLASAGLPWVSLRPCAPYAPRLADHRPSHRESFHVLVDLLRRSPVVPLIGDGEYLRQPVHIVDFCELIGLALDRAPADYPNRAFDVGGPFAYPFRRVAELISFALGRNVRLVSLPPGLFTVASRFVDGFHPDVLSTITSDDEADPRAASVEFGKDRWIRFEDGVHTLLGPWAASRDTPTIRLSDT